jgi:hypothetical protein
VERLSGTGIERLVFCVATGKPKYGEMAMGLGRSLSLIGDMTPRAVVTDISGFDWSRYFDFVFPPKAPRSALDKLLAFDYVDVPCVYALDVDCLAFKRLDPVFESCSGLDLAVQGEWQVEGKWHGADVSDILRRNRMDKLPKFNGGALYYQQTPEFQNLLNRMKKFEANYAETGFGDFRGNASEEVCVALAMMETGIGTVIPDDLNFMNTGSGLIGNLRMDVRSNTCRFLSRKSHVRYVEPHIFHASEYSNFNVYWRQLDHLKRLEAYEDRTRPGYRSRGFKLRRSIERRWLKLRGKLS